MTVRHIVCWKLNGETATERATQAADIEAKLRELPATVPGIVAFDVFRNEYNDDVNWDVALVSDHRDKAALDDYAVHPDHVAVAAFIKERVAQRSGVDAELTGAK